MFTIEQREQIRNRVLEIARNDPRVTGGALTGSMALGGGDHWSDIDLAFGIANGNPLNDPLDDWTEMIEREFGVLDHFDLPSGTSIYRVLLLPSGLEIDMAVSPDEDFGARGPNFHPLFGTHHQVESVAQPSARYLIGWAWHHVLHARSCIERHKPWQAEYWISEIRDHILALACMRLGEPSAHARGIDRLPASETAPLAETLVRSLDESELRRALDVITLCLIAELERWDHELCTRLKPILQEFGLRHV